VPRGMRTFLLFCKRQENNEGRFLLIQERLFCLRKSANIEYVPIKPNQLGKREFDYSSWGQQTDNSPPPTEEVIREIND
jgi:hypothetical protein